MFQRNFQQFPKTSDFLRERYSHAAEEPYIAPPHRDNKEGNARARAPAKEEKSTCARVYIPRGEKKEGGCVIVCVHGGNWAHVRAPGHIPSRSTISPSHTDWSLRASACWNPGKNAEKCGLMGFRSRGDASSIWICGGAGDLVRWVFLLVLFLGDLWLWRKRPQLRFLVSRKSGFKITVCSIRAGRSKNSWSRLISCFFLISVVFVMQLFFSETLTHLEGKLS